MNNLIKLIINVHGTDTSKWNTDTLDMMGPLVTLLPSSVIKSLDMVNPHSTHVYENVENNSLKF